jgi:hypothetical protein
MAGNVNYVGNDPNAVAMRPDYDIEFAALDTVVTNFSYADLPTPQNLGVFGPMLWRRSVRCQPVLRRTT